MGLLLTLFALITFTTLGSMVSGDLNDSRDFWMFSGLAIAITEAISVNSPNKPDDKVG